MAQAKVNNSWFWEILWALLIVAAVFAAQRALQQSSSPSVSWRKVPLDGHRAGALPVTADNVADALGTFSDEAYMTPGGVAYPSGSAIASVASEMIEVQPLMSHLKKVVAHSARMMPNLRTEPDLPLGNFVTDAMRSFGSSYFHAPMDFAIANYGGIRVPMPEGAVTLDDIMSMFPFKNYVVYCKVPGSGLLQLFEQLAETKAFQAVSGARVAVKDHKLVSAEIGGEPIEPSRLYNVCTIDFLLDGGDNIRIGALASDVTLSNVLMRDMMLEYLSGLEARGEVIDYKPEGRVVME